MRGIAVAINLKGVLGKTNVSAIDNVEYLLTQLKDCHLSVLVRVRIDFHILWFVLYLPKLSGPNPVVRKKGCTKIW